MAISVMLSEDQSDELRHEIYTLVTKSIEDARRDTGLDVQYLNRKSATKYAGVSPSTFDRWKIPVHRIDGITLYSKKDILEFIESH